MLIVGSILRWGIGDYEAGTAGGYIGGDYAVDWNFKFV